MTDTPGSILKKKEEKKRKKKKERKLQKNAISCDKKATTKSKTISIGQQNIVQMFRLGTGKMVKVHLMRVRTIKR